MPHAFGGDVTQDQIDEINQLFTALEAAVTDTKLRKDLEKLNKEISDNSGGVVPFVNWNS